jgi:hypothetical protein
VFRFRRISTGRPITGFRRLAFRRAVESRLRDTARGLRSQLQFHGRRREWEHQSSQHPHVQGPCGIVGRRSRISQGRTEVRVRIGQALRRGWPRRLERPLGPIAMCGDVDGAEELKLPRTASTDDVTHYALASAMQTAATEAWAAGGRTASQSNGAAGVAPAWASGSAPSNGSRHLERAGLGAAEPSAGRERREDCGQRR